MLYSTSIENIGFVQDRARADESLYAMPDEKHTPYFVLRKDADVAGRVVVAFVNLHSNGYLRDNDAEFGAADSGNRPAGGTLEIYGVIPQPLSDRSGMADNNLAIEIAQQNHIRAEQLWINYGILNPNGRTVAELAVLNTLGGTHRREHLKHRKDHLLAVRDYIRNAREPRKIRSDAITATDNALRALNDPKLVG